MSDPLRTLALAVLALMVGAFGCQTESGPPSVPGATTAPRVSDDEPVALQERFPPPAGFERIAAAPGEFAAWLRKLPVLPGRPRVLLHDGRPKRNQEAHVAVLDIDVGSADLQQCADAVIRLRSEYLFASPCRDAIAFDFTSGDRARWSEWRDGVRPRVDGNRVSWSRSAEPDAGYENFRTYLDTVFTYAGSASLERELQPVTDPARIEPGDVFIQGGFPGHAVLVLDVVENGDGERRFLLGQSYMPAQQIHVLHGFDEQSPWYPARSVGPLRTPEWEFRYEDLRRFPRPDCDSRPRRVGAPASPAIEVPSSRRSREAIERFELFRTYEICTWSGSLGPKLRQGDGQSPEGFYFVTPGRMNPASRFHLSFNLGYPNAYDRHHGRTGSAARGGTASGRTCARVTTGSSRPADRPTSRWRTAGTCSSNERSQFRPSGWQLRQAWKS